MLLVIGVGVAVIWLVVAAAAIALCVASSRADAATERLAQPDVGTYRERRAEHAPAHTADALPAADMLRPAALS